MAEPGYLTLRAGPAARAALAEGALTPDRIGAVAGAAGGPKFLVLSALDQYLFGDWLPRADHALPLVGSSIGAWRFAAACAPDPIAALQTLESAYIDQCYSAAPDRAEITEMLRITLACYLDDAVIDGVINHPRLRLHALTVRSRGVTATDRRWALAAGATLAGLSNAVRRAGLRHYFERVDFAADGQSLAWANDGLPARTVALQRDNVFDAVFASGNVPLVMNGVINPAGAPPGIYRDGGITDYHIDQPIIAPDAARPIVLMPHYADRLIPGWLDKKLAWRRPRFAANTLMIGPGPKLLERLVGQHVPERRDFYRYAGDDAARRRAWQQAVDAGRHMRDAFANLVENNLLARYVTPL